MQPWDEGKNQRGGSAAAGWNGLPKGVERVEAAYCRQRGRQHVRRRAYQGSGKLVP